MCEDMMEISVRKMQLTDVKDVVDVHLQAFHGFFLTFLGQNFLRELYNGVIVDSSGIGFVWEQENHIQGFIVGTDQPAGLYLRLLRQRWWRFALASAGPILRKPTIVPMLLRAFLRPQKVSIEEGRGTLMSIAVLPVAQGMGIGQALVKIFLDEASRRGLMKVDLTTDKNNNDSINTFYQKLGFIGARSFVTQEGREMNEYLINL